GRYREFLLNSGTLFTLVSGLLLVAATVQRPTGVVSSGAPEDAGTPLYLASALIGSVYIWWTAAQGIRERNFTADVPVSIATAAAIAIGQYSAAAVVVVLLLVGGMLEEFVAARAGRALGALERLLPERVTVRRAGRDEVVLLKEVQIGDLLLVRSGERIAVDGTVVSGTAWVNQATITGESLTVEKRAGDEVLAGTLSEVGALEMRVEKAGDETTLGQIRRMVEEAQEKKAPIERALNRYAKFYTPLALLFGALLWWSGDILRAITMLIVFCPCVMVLATPTALVASIGNAAMRGSLVKRGATVEALAKVDTLAFDKTGTLTFGKPRLVEVIPLNGLGEVEVLEISAVAEKFSEHPIGRAVVWAAKEWGLDVPDPEEFEALPGLGVRASTDGEHRLLVGRPRFLAERGVLVGKEVQARTEKLAAPGRTVILVANGEEAAGLLVLEDALRGEAKTTMGRLNELGVRTLLVTGDNRTNAERVAAALGIDEVYAEALPHEKVCIVKGLQTEGRRVAFVGDGVNDGPALATADVGIAMALGGTDVAVETAEIGLLSDDLSKVAHLLDLSQKAMRAIRQNLVFSLGVLALAVGLTIPGVLTPVTGALLHELSSIPVIANSARLIGLKEKALFGA
ncbi:MAG TPA: cation-translocating P-type ATPase, partial [Rubrobacteraceae bacterium]|nr:cation-translocating P-type ATPase [Rubrobacteraceae bacterium]